MHGIYEDVRAAWRHLARSPRTMGAAVAVLALTVGANLTVVSLLNAVAFRPLPVRDAGRLVLITATDEAGRAPRLLYESDVAHLSALPVFESILLHSGGGLIWTEARGVNGEGAIEAVAPGLHEALGLRPHLGRFLEPADGTAAEPGAVISHRFWTRFYGADPNAIGERLSINTVPFVVVGVLPEAYRGLYPENGVDFAVPIGVLGRQLATNQYPAGPPGRPVRANNGVGYLRAGVTLDEARAAIETAWAQVRAGGAPPGAAPADAAARATQRVAIASLTAGVSNVWARNRDLLLAIAGSTVVLLVLGCVSLAGLLLARLADREHDLFVHQALGATRGRLARRLLIEGGILAALGTLAGMAVAFWTSRAFAQLLWEGATAMSLAVTPDARVVAVGVALVVLIAMLIAAVPAYVVLRRPATGPARTVTRSGGGWSKALQVAQLALSLALVVHAGFFASSLSRLRALDPGVRADGIRWTRLLQRPGGYRGIQEAEYYPELQRRLAAAPGIDAVSFSHHFPAYFNFSELVTEFAMSRSDAAPSALGLTGMMEYVAPGFFDTLGLPLLQGRDITWADDASRPPVALVNEALAARLFPDGAIGRHLRIGDDPARAAVEVIGIVPNATMGGYRATRQPVAFRPRAQEPRFMRAPVVVFRSALGAQAADQAVTAVVDELGREYVRRIYSLEEQVDRTLSRERMMAWVAAVFAGVAALAAAIGLFSLVAHSVARRTREIGVRIALGASRPSVAAMVLREGLTLTVAGIAIGVPLALAGGRLTASMLFGVPASSALVIGASAALLAAVGAVACLRPALRASAVEPQTALRCD